MTLDLTQGRLRRCKNSTGGVKKVWLAPYKKHPYSSIITEGVFLKQIPSTIFYLFEVVGNPNFNETEQENEGGKYYNQDLSFDLIGNYDNYQVQKLTKLDFWIVIEDENGKMRILGLYNGLGIDKITSLTGGSKSDFNGFKISANGQEDKRAFFIENLDDIGFVESRLLLEDTNFVLLEDGNKIFL